MEGVEEERVVAGSGDGSVYCFRGSDGKVMWSTRLGKVRREERSERV